MPRNLHTPKFRVRAGRPPTELPPGFAGRVVEIVVDQSIDAADVAKVVLRNDDFRVSDHAGFKPGSRLEIELGYEEDGGTLTQVFQGEVTALGCDFPRRGPMLARVVAHTEYHRLKRGRQTRSFVQTTYADIARTIASECKLEALVDATPGSREYVFQQNQTNLEFLLRMAEDVGYEVFAREGKLFFRKPTHERGSIRVLKKGEDLLDFNPKTAAALRPTGAHVRSWDPVAVKGVVGEAKAADAGPTMGGAKFGPAVSAEIGEAVQAVRDRVYRKEADARARAVATLKGATLDFVRGEGTVQGSPELKPGVVVEVKDIGKIFSGTYYVQRVVHVYLPAGFATRIGVKKTSIELPPAPADAAPERAPAPGNDRAAPPPAKKTHFIDVQVVDPDGNPIVGEPARVVSNVDAPRDIRLGERGVHLDGIPAGERRVVLPSFFLPLSPPQADRIPVEPPRGPRLFNARWDRSRARCGTEVKLRVSAVDIDPGTAVVFRIYRADALSPEDVAAFVETRLEKPEAVEVAWTFRPGEPGPDEPFRPARFYFLAQAGDARSRSGTIEFTDSISFEARASRGGPAVGRRFRLRFPSGEELDGAFDAAGRAAFEDVPPGRYEIILL